MEKRKKKAVIAMSGGVDSSVTALLMKNQGYEVEAVTGKMVNTENADTIIQNAKRIADKLNIKLHVLDVSKKFQKEIIEYFEASYFSGATPNPCIMCNKFIKWGEIFDYAVNTLGADIFATGHYAEVRNIDGIYKLYPAKDEHKDQLYFLYRLTQKQLSKTIFPLHVYDKAEVKKIANENDLPSKSSKESQDICFIQKPLTSKKYLTDRFGHREGDFIDINTGKKLGTHDGFYQYTIGQRKGIGIAAPYPLYVVKIDAQNNTVYLGRNEDTFSNIVTLTNLNFTYPVDKKEFDAFVKIRYNMSHKKAHVKVFDDRAEIVFNEPVNSVTPGQAGVLYDIADGHLIGGGITTF